MKQLYILKYSGTMTVEAWCPEHALDQIKIYIRDLDYFVNPENIEVAEV